MDGGKKILIVDDSEMNRSLLADMLSDQFDIVEAENGADAAAILCSQEAEVALVLLDIVMPVMDGFELLALMNKNGWIKSVPVIMISAETVPAYVDRAYDLGVMDYITRPFDERTVRHRVVSAIMLSAKQKELSYMVTEQMYEKEKTSALMIEILANLVEFRNGESGLHVLHIQTITELLLDVIMRRTDKYSIPKSDRHLICNAAALHDIGKIAIPSHILNKPSSLTDEETTIMRTHTTEGARILAGIPMRENEPLIKYGYEICRWHHERYDGGGYPDGLVGDDIPISAQVVGIADAYDALTSRRVYKPAYDHDTAIKMIVNGECGVFNPLLIECLLEVEGDLEKSLQGINRDRISEKELLSTLEEMSKGGAMNASERTFRLLERERNKYQFFADLSREILFEYISVPEAITLTERSAETLHMPEMIVNPRESEFGRTFFRDSDFDYLLTSLENTTPENPYITEQFRLNINGQERWCEVVARSLWAMGENPVFEGAIGKIADIHENVEKMKYLEEQVELEPMTGLLNHKAAKLRICERLKNDTENSHALIMFDLDDFKKANDEFGHLFGDELLKYVADTIKSGLRSDDIAARVGGDEFIVFATYKGTILPLIERLFARLTGDYKGFGVSLSMGVALAEDCGGDYEQLFHMADTAMYTAKRAGKHAYRIYDSSMDMAN
jgi:putative two-component system response regulator